ncbi:MAG: sugar phosphate isomerase/epimerase family protein [Acutalibacteraceae bacterium]
MLLTTQTDMLGAYFGDIRAIEMIADAGFDAIDYSMFEIWDNGVFGSDGYLDYTYQLKAAADAKGIGFVQAHAPFRGFQSLENEEEILKNESARAKRAIEIAGILGADVIVIHPMQFKSYFFNEAYFKDVNMRFYRELLPYAEKYNVKIACENMWQKNKSAEHIVDSVCADPREFNDYIDTINSEYFTACLDLGHCGLTCREAQDCLRAMGSRVGALHVHDNDYKGDRHTVPGYGDMNWDEITKALADIGYSGSFTFEADNFLKPLKDEESAFCALKLMESIGRSLIKKIEQYK